MPSGSKHTRASFFLVNIVIGDVDKRLPYRNTLVKQLTDFCREEGVPAFPVVLIDADMEHAMSALLQTVSVGPVRPNLAIFGWTDESDRVAAAVRQYRIARDMGMSLVLIHPGYFAAYPGPKRIDVWWRGLQNGNLMGLLAYMLTCNPEWADTHLRLLRQVAKPEAREGTADELRQLLATARIQAEAVVIVDEAPFEEILDRESADAACVILGFEVPEQDEADRWHQHLSGLCQESPTSIFVCSIGDEDMLA